MDGPLAISLGAIIRMCWRLELEGWLDRGPQRDGKEKGLCRKIGIA